MRIVFLSRWYPFPPDNGSKLRIYNLLRQLGHRHEVTLLTFAESSDRVDDESRAMLTPPCRALRVFPYRSFRPTSGRALAGLLAPQPRYLVDTYNPDLDAALAEYLARQHPDLIIASQLAMMPYAVRRPGWRSLLEELELAGFRDAIRDASCHVSKLRARLTWAKLTRYVARSLAAFDACTVVSEAERQLVARVAPGYTAVHVIPNAVDTDRPADRFGAPEPGSLVFAGALSYRANYQGVRWFLRTVYPRILVDLPDARFRITGSIDGIDLTGLSRLPGCELTGYLHDVRPIIARSMVSVVPLLTGGGTRLKILESMSLGTPVVSTSKGAEGLDVSHGENILIADDPAEMATYVTAVIRSPELRQHLAAGGRALVRARYSWDIVGPLFCDLVERTVATGTAPVEGGSHEDPPRDTRPPAITDMRRRA